MASVNNYAKRESLGNIIENGVNGLFDPNEVIVVPFGLGRIGALITDVNLREEFLGYFMVENVYDKPSSMIVNYAPDFILFKKTKPQEIYFLETKCSITPCWSRTRVETIQRRNPGKSLNESNIGEIAREALLAYRRYYPNTIFLYGSTYNSKLLMAQFANKIDCLYCYKGNGEYDCNNCPYKNNGFFEMLRIQDSNGSGTPNTNVNLDSFVGVTEFFRTLGITINDNKLTEIKSEIRKRNVYFPDSVHDVIKNRILKTLKENGCGWVNV